MNWMLYRWSRDLATPYNVGIIEIIPIYMGAGMFFCVCVDAGIIQNSLELYIRRWVLFLFPFVREYFYFLYHGIDKLFNKQNLYFLVQWDVEKLGQRNLFYHHNAKIICMRRYLYKTGYLHCIINGFYDKLGEVELKCKDVRCVLTVKCFVIKLIVLSYGRDT